MSSINQCWTVDNILDITSQYDAIPERVQRFIASHLSYLQWVNNDSPTWDGIFVEQIVNYSHELVTRVCAEEPQCIDSAYDLIRAIEYEMLDTLDAQPKYIRPAVFKYVERNHK